MYRHRAGFLTAAFLAATSTTMLTNAAQAGGFKAKYYPECYAPVAQAREMIPPPPADIAGKVQAASDVANTVSKIPGLGGFGGFGAFGGAAKQATTYSNLISDAAKFTSKMQQDYPDAATRMAAYGDKMTLDANKTGEAALKIDVAHTCYANARDALRAGVASGEIKVGDAKDRAKEILGGLKESKSVLDDSRTTMDINMKGYNEALTTDSGSMGLDLGALAQTAAAGHGLAAINPAAGEAGPYDAYVGETNAYQRAWFDGYSKSGGDVNAAKLSALAAIQKDGGASANAPVPEYQQAYWAAQAQQAAKGQTISAQPAQALGSLSALQSLGGLSGLSGGGAAWVAANGGIGAIGSAINGGAAGAAPAAQGQVAASGPDVGKAMSTVNTMKGMSGGGAAWVAANGGIGAIGDALKGKNKQKEEATAQQAAAAPELSPAMRSSLMKASVDNGKFADAYGLVSWQSQRNAEIAAAVE